MLQKPQRSHEPRVVYQARQKISQHAMGKHSLWSLRDLSLREKVIDVSRRLNKSALSLQVHAG
jgi:hypothetical protein